MMKHLVFIFFTSLLFTNCVNAQEIKTISTLEVKELLSKDKIQLVDVRTPVELRFGYIESAVFINYFDNNFTEKSVSKLDKNKPVYLYCRTGNRSEKASKILQEKGFKVYNILGGYNQWKKENKK
ncbi:MAG: rhodanese-like domain-containing protein [Polaribacter sp.]|uniref:rhodanese-like domain-containing protein n=1 Tax=Polaribacter sp. TaxID=1920175 RepID=UPI0032667DAA